MKIYCNGKYLLEKQGIIINQNSENNNVKEFRIIPPQIKPGIT
jgi:hypothetical protein